MRKFNKLILPLIVAVAIVLSPTVFMNTASASQNKYTAENPLKLLCIGDSITHGSGVADENGIKRYHTSYRYPLWKKFIDNNYHVEFVGNRDKNFDENCAEVGSEYKGHVFNNKHAAHYGATLHGILNGYVPVSKNENTLDENGNFVEPIATVPPLKDDIVNIDFDAVIIFLGTNTLTIDGTIVETDEVKVEEMKQIINVLREKNPNVVIYITQILATSKYTEVIKIDAFSPLNVAYQEIADTMSTDASPIICMQTNNQRWKTGDFYLNYIDGIHPDEYGDDYLSEIFLTYMRPLLNGDSNVKSVTEPFESIPVENPVKPKKVKLITKRITPKTKVIKGKTNVKNAEIIMKIGKKTIAEAETNKKGVFKANVKLKKYKPGKKITIQAIKYYEAADYSEIIKKSPILKVKIKK